MATLIIVPGWRNSGEAHWQSLWAEEIPGAVRVQQDDWITPSRRAWVASISRTVLEQPGPVVIAAHSLGCIATAHLPDAVVHKIHSALLVAPADPERRNILSDFAPVPRRILPYQSTVVASNDDPFCPVRIAAGYATAWGSDLVRLQNAGHINVDAGFGPWPLGRALVQLLLDKAAHRP